MNSDAPDGRRGVSQGVARGSAWLIAGNLVTPLGSIHGVLLQREMRFRAMTLRDLMLSGLASALTIAAVLGGLGLWSLVLPELLVGAVGVVLNWWLHPWRPRLRLSAGYWPRIFRYGRYLLGDGLLGFLNNNADYMIIGKILGTGTLDCTPSRTSAA